MRGIKNEKEKDRRRKHGDPYRIMKDNCEYCLYYEYDEEYECYTCSMSLDEDELRLFLTSRFAQCPYYRPGDEYTIVRKQN